MIGGGTVASSCSRARKEASPIVTRWVVEGTSLLLAGACVAVVVVVGGGGWPGLARAF